MGEPSPPGIGHDSLHVRKTLDEVLAKEITFLLGIDSSTTLEAYNLTTLACIVVAVDRKGRSLIFPIPRPNAIPVSRLLPSFPRWVFIPGTNLTMT